MKPIPELKYLLSEVEKHYGRRIATTTDFEALSVVIEHEIGEMISASTLKRLWGYVTSNPVPRGYTLDVLSRFVGMRDFIGFCEHIRKNSEFESSFFTSSFVQTSDLVPGRIVRLGWNPNRIIEVEYLGDNSFKVLSNCNSHLMEGDIFKAGSFIKGYPMYIPDLVRDGESLGSYVAGSKEGLSLVELPDSAS